MYLEGLLRGESGLWTGGWSRALLQGFLSSSGILVAAVRVVNT